ncbi:MAG: ATP-grasp domain-containing protein [Oligoflexales bacterium]
MIQKSYENTHTRLGVLGAGQLSLMLIEAAKQMGYAVDIVADSSNDPAAPEASKVVVGNVTDIPRLQVFLSQVDCVAIEKELTDPEVFRAIPATELSKIHPALDAVALCSDKLRQKHKLKEIGVPTSPWEEFSPGKNSAEAWLAKLQERFPGGFVIKWARGGFDGRGTCIVKELSPKMKNHAASFMQKASQAGTEVYGEELIPFECEVAVVAVRKASDETTVYPTVLTLQWEGICSEVQGPAAAFVGRSTVPQLEIAEALARKVGQGFSLVGTYAVEFFVTKDGRVLVNEIAPRVHNSGHFTLQGAQTSQFENHWRALLNLPLGSTETSPYFGMVNILGPENYEGKATPPYHIETPDISVKWYGKHTSRARRKMGHINILANSKAELGHRMEIVRNALGSWSTSYGEKTDGKQ